MQPITNLRTRIALVLSIVLLFTIFLPSPVATAQSASFCMPQEATALKAMGKRVPVILVHGFNGGPADTWFVPGGMQDAISKIPGIYADFHHDALDYQKTNRLWVAVPNGNYEASGPSLARMIACQAEVSRENGGPGKVILIAYSLGGVVAKYAATHYLGSHAVADDIGEIIDIASPSGGVAITEPGVLLYDTVCLYGFVSGGLCTWQPIADAMQTNVFSHVNTLLPIPKAIPVFTIAGSVKSVLDYFNRKLPYTDTDLFVSIASATKDQNILANGLGGAIVYQCFSSKLPALYVSNADCDHFHLSHSVKVESAVVQQIEKYIYFLHPPCPSGAGTCIGVHNGDMDADGIPDWVGVTWVPDTCASGTPSSCQMVAHIILDSGDVIDAPIPWNFNGAYNIISLQFMGLSDVNGDGRDEIFLNVGGDCNTCSVVLPLELHQGTLQPLNFPGAFSPYGVGLSLGIAGTAAGFTCKKTVNGKHQVLVTSWPVSSNMVNEQLYQANTDGTESLIKQDTATYNQQQLAAASGAHCPGLSVS